MIGRELESTRELEKGTKRKLQREKIGFRERERGADGMAEDLIWSCQCQSKEAFNRSFFPRG